MPVHTNISKETINRILGKVFMECAHFELVVHAHRTEHEIKNVEQYNAYRHPFFFVCAKISKELYNAETVNEPCCGIHGIPQIICSIYR